MVVEAVWAYRRQPNVGGTLRKRQTVQQLAEEADASLACREHYFRFHRQRKVSATGGTILSVASNVSLVPGLRRAAGDLFLAS